MIDRHQKLTDQLTVIADVLAITIAKTDDERQQELLAVIGRAMTAANDEHQAGLAEDALRPKLRLIIGGLGALAPVGVCATTLARIRQHHTAVTAAASTAAISLAIGAAFLFGHTPPGPDQAQGPPAASSAAMPGTTDTGTPPASSPPASSTPEPEPAPTSPPVSAPGPGATSHGFSVPVDLAGPTLTTPTDDEPPPPTAGSPSPTWTVTPTEDPTRTPTATASPKRGGLCVKLSLPPILGGGVCLLGA